MAGGRKKDINSIKYSCGKIPFVWKKVLCQLQVINLHGLLVRLSLKRCTWVRAVANKAHGRVGGVKHRQGSVLNGVWQHASQPCAA